MSNILFHILSLNSHQILDSSDTASDARLYSISFTDFY